MSNPHPNNSILRAACHLAFAVAMLATAIRVAHLARTDSSTPASAPGSARLSSPKSAGGQPVATQAIESADAVFDKLTPRACRGELAELYKACPLAAVIDLKTVANSPERVDEILPPYRETADRIANPPLEPAIPRIRYPVRLQRTNASAAPGSARLSSTSSDPEPAEGSSPKSAGGSELRIAQGPRIAKTDSANKSDWLIDPKDWFTPGEQPSAKVGGVSDAESAPPSEPATPSPPDSSAAPHSPFPTPHSSLSAPSTPPPPAALSPPAPQTLFAPPAPVGEPPASAGGYAVPAPGAPAPATEQLPAPPASSEHPASSIEHPVSRPAPGQQPAVDPHLELFTKNAYPSARECAVCHEEIYDEWSVSAHAYAAVSPMFNKFEQKLNDLSKGTVGYFCIRCHAPVATSLCATRDEPLWNLPEAAREGITCVACHRVQYAYGKSNGERRIETGDIFAPVFGGIGGDGVAEAIAHKDQLKVKTAPNEPGPGQNIHIAGVYFQPLTRSEFCTPCHQVAVQPGIKLEVVWEQYRASPACKKGIQCQDCHMGRVPGLPLGYDCGPVAKVAGKTVNDNRKKSNHIFYGPNYPIAHPGVFPFNLKANRWTMDQWLTFDWRAGWGTKEFEDRVADGQVQCTFPPVWAEADDRLDAREIIDANIKKLELKRDLRVQVMENGSHVEGPIFDSSPCRGTDLDLHFIVTNTNDGHNLLTASLGAQPQLWANIVLIGPDGARLWETGYTDSWGDVANIHSHDVREKTLPYDWQLFNLQSMFLITGAKGTDREFYVPVNVDIDQLPFIRPGTQPITTINHPPLIRMESQSLAPLGSRRVPYRIPGELIRQPGKYRLSFRMRSRSEPIYFMQFCGATEEMVRSMNEWMIDLHPMSVEFVVP